MDGQFWITLLKILVFFPLIIALILIFGKVGSKFSLGSSNKYMKVLERLPLSKDNSLAIVKMGGKGYVISCSSGKTEILRELEPSEMDEVIKLNELSLQQINKGFEDMKLQGENILKIYSKLKLKKSRKD